MHDTRRDSVPTVTVLWMENGMTMRVSLETFVAEMQRDLPTLIIENPGGIFISDLASYYGESPARVKAAINVLATHHIVQIHQTIAKSYFITPSNYTLQLPFPELTDLQRALLLYLRSVCHQYNTNTVKTNYAFLARQLHASSGGVKSALHRLSSLSLLLILMPSIRGQSDQLLLELPKVEAHSQEWK